MNFVNSFLLWTAVGSFLPFLIYMLNREKHKRIAIPTVKFIIRAVEKSSKKHKPRLILLIRTLILICLSLIIARPQIGKFMSSDNTLPVQVVLIVDNAFYSAHLIKNNRSQLSIIKEKARKIIKELPEGSRVCILSCDEFDGEFTEIKTQAFKKVERLSPAPSLIDIHSMISTAGKLLNKSQANADKRIYVLSDMNLGSWQNNYKLNSSSSSSIRLVPISPRRGNIFINDVTVKTQNAEQMQPIFAKRTAQVQTEIRGDRSLIGTKVSFMINDKMVDDKTISVDAYTKDINFTTSFEKSGTYFCEVFIDSNDGIDDDNHFYFTVYVQPPVKILVLNDTNAQNPLYYKAALAPSGWHGQQKYDVQIVNYSAIKVRLDQQLPQLVILGGDMNLTDKNWDQLKLYVENGGSLMICPDEKTDFKELNRGALLLFQSRIVPFEEKVSLLPSTESPFAKELDIDSVNIQRASSFEKKPKGKLLDVPIHFSNKKPCLLIQQLGKGKSIFWGLSPEPTSSNFLNSESFPLIWHMLAKQFTNYSMPSINSPCNEPVDIKAKKGKVYNVKIQSPTGIVDRIPKDNFTLNVTNYTQTFFAGHYKSSSATYGGFSCNIERNNAIYQYPSENTYAHLVQNEDSKNKKGAAQTILSPDGLLLILILAILILMVFEIHLGNRNYYADN